MSLPEITVFLLVVFLVFRPVQAAWLFVRPPRLRVAYRSPEEWGAAYETVQLTTVDGMPLMGWYLPSRNGAAVLLLHGHGGNRLALSFQAQLLWQAGFGVLMLDLRRHGNSGGQTFGLNAVTVGDVQTAVSYLSKRPDLNVAGIGVFGVSVGGTLALHAAARTVAIRAVAVDAPSPALFADMPPPDNWYERLVAWPLQAYYMVAQRWFGGGSDLAEITAVLPRLAHRPLLFMVSGQGRGPRLMRHWFAAAHAPKQLWELPQAAYGVGWRKEPEAYGKELVTFFNEALAHLDGESGEVQLPHVAETAVVTNAAPPLDPDVAYEATVPMGAANWVGLLLLPLVGVLFGLPFQWVWGQNVGLELVQLLQQTSLLTMLAVLLGSIVAHEGLHALGFVWVGGVEKTAVSFGFSWRTLAPFTYCRAPLPISIYRLTVALPGLLLGAVPGVLGLLLGNAPLLLFGGWMIVAASGDVAVLWVTRRVQPSAKVRDHPTQAGCLVLK
ncbi:MAG: alpha/beta fold hydrolase [Chloroflexota bacterium]